MSPARSSEPPEAAGEPQDAAERLLHALRYAREVYEGMYLTPYRSAIHREYLRERDLFLLLTFSELLGVPNPVQFYTLELYPELLEHFHEWHLRLGLPNAPEGGWRCC
ncbi:MAG TPA: cory-CC-star protein [Longimicrobiaceae bacterium]|nr:cory-CC-star protein [Longimicrobiaceae bacterium]